MSQPLFILVAGPYRSGTGGDPDKIRHNHETMLDAALALFASATCPPRRVVCPALIAHAGSQAAGDPIFDEIFHPISRRLAERVDAVLRVGGPSAGADEMVDIAAQRGSRSSQASRKSRLAPRDVRRNFSDDRARDDSPARTVSACEKCECFRTTGMS